MYAAELDTPSVLIDLDIMEANIRRMQAYCNSLGLKFRPHTKTHKIPDIARMQLEAGAVGIACQKVSEAEVFAQAGFNDIQIPYNIVGERKTRRLVDLALYNRVTVSADHPMVLAGLADAAKAEDMALRVLLDLGTALQRTGAEPREIVTMAERIEGDENLHFAGILVYPSDPEARPALQETLALLDAAGIGVDVVSGGGFGAARFADQLPELTELRVGTYVFGDYGSVTKGWCTLEDCAMRIAATVVSRPTTDRVILDSGSKTLAADSANGVHGYILEYPEARIYKLSEEHAHCDFSACEERPVIGERVHVIPVHTCVVTNLHNQIYGVRGGVWEGEVEVEWPVAARGLVY
jgi:D-serine deaminase-like pyridoxal phosphate-dependent protein